MENSNLITMRKISTSYNVSLETIRYWHYTKKINEIKRDTRNRIYFDKSEVESFIQSRNNARTN